MATIDLFTVKCPVPFFVVQQYSSLQDAYYNVSPVTTTIFSSTDTWATAARIYTDLAKTANAALAWYVYNSEIREGIPGIYGGIAVTILQAPDTSVPPTPYGTRESAYDYCDTGLDHWMEAYSDGVGGYFYVDSLNSCPI